MTEWLRLAAAALAQSDQVGPGQAGAAAGAAELVVVEPRPAAVQTVRSAEVVVAGAEAAGPAGRG